MATYRAAVDTAWDRDRAFAYLADFASISDWDPGVVSSKRLTDDPLVLGARFEVVSSFLGRQIPLTYEVIEIDPPRRVLLRAATSTMTSLDEMTFDLRPGGGTIVTYDADLTMKGVARVAELPMRLAFARLGDNARDGLRNRLAEAPPARGHDPATRDRLPSHEGAGADRDRRRRDLRAARRPPSCTAPATRSPSSRPRGYAGGHTNTITVAEPPADRWTSTPASSSSTTATTRTSSACSPSSAISSQPANMSFGVSDGRGGFEWAARGARGIFARPRHLVDPQFIRMLSDLRPLQPRGPRARSAVNGERPVARRLPRRRQATPTTSSSG